MKSRLKSVLMLLVALVATVWTAQAQSTGKSTGTTSQQRAAPFSHEADSMNRALKRVFRKAEAVTLAKNKLLAGYGFDQEGACLWGSYLTVGQQNTLDMYFQGGRSYFFVGAGDDYVTNVDVLITDTKGRVLAQDTESGKEAGVLFKPKYNGGYKVILRLKAGNRSGLCALACLKKPGGWILDQPQFMATVDAFKSSVQNCWKVYRGGTFLHSGQWCLVLGVVKQGKSLSWSHTVPRGLLAVLVGQDGHSQNLKLYLANTNKQVVVADTNHVSAPSLAYISPKGGNYIWQVNADKTEGPSLVMVGLLKLPKG